MATERETRFEIIQPGISISSKYSTNGTLGLIVFDNTNNKPCILSNWHVLAKNSFLPRTSFRVGRPIFQPGKLFQGKRNTNIIARLTRHDRHTDSAMAEIVSRDFILNQYESNVTITTARIPQESDIVEKSGTRTGVTRGKIVDVNGHRVKIKPIEEGNPNNQEISDGGDSGCLWYDPNTMEGLVLHNSGETDNNPNSEFAKGYSLIAVMERLNFSLTENN
jgi:hypothetical protein